MKHRAFLTAVASAIALSSCTNNEIDTPNNQSDGGIPITISTYLPRTTRTDAIVETTIASMVDAGFTITAVNDTSGNVVIDNEVFQVTDEDQGTCAQQDGEMFFWPGDTTVTFYATYPAASDDPDGSNTWVDVENKLLYASPEGTWDIIGAVATGRASVNNGQLTLTFKHLPAQVVVNVKCDNANYGYVLTSAKLSAPSQLSYNFKTQTISIPANVGTKSYSMLEEGQYKSVNTTLEGLDTLMIAADGTDGTSCRMEVSFETHIADQTQTYTKTANVTLVAGYVNTVNVTLAGNKPLTVSGAISGWTKNENGYVIDANGHDYVDLGLPSGTLWATCNIGAENPEDYGDYYAWGETSPHYSVNDADTIWLDDYSGGYAWSLYGHCDGTYNTLTKYCNNGEYGTEDYKSVLDAEDDAATANWGSGWRMPTQAEWAELINGEYTTTEWTTLNGVNGRMITGKSNGNSIFLPVAGYFVDTYLLDAGSYGYYWSSSLNESSPDYAWSLYFYSSSLNAYYGRPRFRGQSVRPVIKLLPPKIDL
ncbi:MAG: fimbrillin family protein [Paludibacteraceae bacterium]|nr:fimbrillin family protein [Paludibacteraceae bacterium]